MVYDKELEEAHTEYELERCECIIKLKLVRDGVVTGLTREQYIDSAISFIERKEV